MLVGRESPELSYSLAQQTSRSQSRPLTISQRGRMSDTPLLAELVGGCYPCSIVREHSSEMLINKVGTFSIKPVSLSDPQRGKFDDFCQNIKKVGLHSLGAEDHTENEDEWTDHENEVNASEPRQRYGDLSPEEVLLPKMLAKLGCSPPIHFPCIGARRAVSVVIAKGKSLQVRSTEIRR